LCAFAMNDDGADTLSFAPLFTCLDPPLSRPSRRALLVTYYCQRQ